MITDYIVYQNGIKVTKLENTTDENAIIYADKYAEQHKNDWVSVRSVETKQKIYHACVEMGVREIK